MAKTAQKDPKMIPRDVFPDLAKHIGNTKKSLLLRGRSRHKKLFVFMDQAQKVPNTASYFKGVYDSCQSQQDLLFGHRDQKSRTQQL